MDETTAQLRQKMNNAIGRNNDQIISMQKMNGNFCSSDKLTSESIGMQVLILNNQSLIMRMLMRMSSSSVCPKY